MIVHYGASWFILDLVASIPVELLMFVIVGDGEASGNNSVYRFPQLLKLMKLLLLPLLLLLLRVRRA